MVRISNVRMSGTALGTIVPHIAPDSTIEGPLSLVEDGDLIELDVNNRKIHLYIPESVLSQRRQKLIFAALHFQ